MAVSNQDVINFLASNPGMSDADIAAAMEQYGVSPSQMAQATGLSEGEVVSRVAATVPFGQAKLLGDTWVQPQYSVIGSGEDQQIGGIENVTVYKTSGGVNDSIPTGTEYQQYSPTGVFERTGTTQAVDNSLLPFLLGSAALFGGLGGGFDGLFGGTSAADAAAAAADADIAGGLIPEFGTNAAYGGFMAGAMTPEALAALEAIVAANPEIIGSGALLTDAAAGLTPAVTPTGGATNVVTNPTTPVTPTTPTTPVTPVTPTTPAVTPVTPVPPTVPSVLPTDITKYLTPSVVASLTGLFGGSVLNRAMSGGGGSTPATPVSIPTQGMPLNSQDYFNAIQQNYNQLMPAVPRDVATPLAAWYNSKYGA